MFRKTLWMGCAIALTVMIATPAWCAGNGAYAASGFGTSISVLPYEDVSEVESTGLRYMREEEKLARDVYMAMDELWGHWVFTNIVRSEQRHMDTVGTLLEKYELDDPIVDDTPGVFTDPGLQALYSNLLTTGQASLADAIRVGATIEEWDIDDLVTQLTLADNEDIRTVYQNLMKASRNHLRAFVYQLSLLGEVYVPQFLSREDYQAIIEAAPERGPVDENGDPVDAGTRNGEGMQNRFRIDNTDSGCVLGDDLLSRRGGGNGGGGYGPGDGSDNGGNGPKDGSGNGRKAGTCVNSAGDDIAMILARGGNHRGGRGPGDGLRSTDCPNA